MSSAAVAAFPSPPARANPRHSSSSASAALKSPPSAAAASAASPLPRRAKATNESPAKKRNSTATALNNEENNKQNEETDAGAASASSSVPAAAVVHHRPSFVNPRNQYLSANPVKKGETLSKVLVSLEYLSAKSEFEVRFDLLPCELLSPRVLKFRGPARQLEIIELRPADFDDQEIYSSEPSAAANLSDRDKDEIRKRRGLAGRIKKTWDETIQEEVFKAEDFIDGTDYVLVAKDPRKQLAKLLTEQEKLTFKEEFVRFDRNNDGLISFDEIRSAYAEMIAATSEQVRTQFQHLNEEKLQRKLRAVEVKAESSVRMMMKQDVDRDGKLNWKEFLYAQAYRMKILGLLKGRTKQERKERDNEMSGVDGSARVADESKKTKKKKKSKFEENRDKNREKDNSTKDKEKEKKGSQKKKKKKDKKSEENNNNNTSSSGAAATAGGNLKSPKNREK